MNNFDYDINPKQLRECQIGAHKAILDHFSSDGKEKHVLLELPTGTGKTPLIAILPFRSCLAKIF